MRNKENELEGAKRIVIIESYILAIIIICGGIGHGAESGQWLETAGFAGMLLVIMSILMVLTFCRAKQRMRDCNCVVESKKIIFSSPKDQIRDVQVDLALVTRASNESH